MISLTESEKMSYLVNITKYLNDTKELSINELNLLIQTLDLEANPIDTRAFAHTVLGYMMSAKYQGESPTFKTAYEKATKLKTRQAWLFVESAEVREEVAPTTETKPKSKTTKSKSKTKAKPKTARSKQRTAVKEATGMNKTEYARQIYYSMEDKSKSLVVPILQDKLQTSAAGATTYYYKCVAHEESLAATA